MGLGKSKKKAKNEEETKTAQVVPAEAVSAEIGAEKKTILMMGFPSGWSHYFQQVKLARQLIAKGHKVIFICDSATRESKVDFTGITEVLVYDVDWSWQQVKEYWAKVSRMDPVKGTESITDFICSYFKSMCQQITPDLMKEKGIDFVVLDHCIVAQYCLVHSLKVPTIIYHTVGGYEPLCWYYGFPLDLSCVPMTGSGFDKNMDEISQITNTALYFANRNAYDGILKQYQGVQEEGWADYLKKEVAHLCVENMSDKGEMAQIHPTAECARTDWVLGGIWIVPPALEFRQSMPKDTFFAPPLLPEPGAPLPEEYTKILDNCEKAAVFSLGTFGFTDEDGKELDQRIVDALGGLDIPVFMKSLGDNIKPPENVHVMDWLPQNDLLAHEKIQLFVTHCGMNSLVESVYHGTPMVGVPRFGDQFDNCARMTMSGAAIKLDVKTDDQAAMTAKFQQVLDNPQYLARAKEIAAEMQETSKTQMTCLDRVEWFMTQKSNPLHKEKGVLRELAEVKYPEHFKAYLEVAGIEIDFDNETYESITGKLMGPILNDYDKYAEDVANAVQKVKNLGEEEVQSKKMKFKKDAAEDPTGQENRRNSLLRLGSSQKLLIEGDDLED